MDSKIFAVCIVAMVLLAGCGGGGGDGGESNDVTIENAGSLEKNVGPGEQATVKAKVVGDDGVDHVNLSYTVRNRNGTVVADKTVHMQKIDGETYQRTIPGYGPGYKVSYEVRAYYDGGDQESANSEYKVEMVESVLGDAGETVKTVKSSVDVELHTLDSVEEVRLTVTRKLERDGGATTKTKTYTKRPTNETVSFTYPNQRLGETAQTIDVTYNVTVVYGPNATWKDSGRKYSYTAKISRADVLFVPIALSTDDAESAANVSRVLSERAEKMSKYYEAQTQGEVSLSYDFLTNDSSSNGYFVVNEDATNFYNASTQSNEFKRGKVACEAVSEIDNAKNVKFSQYRSIAFVVATEEGHSIRGIAFNLPKAQVRPNCVFEYPERAEYTPTILLSENHPYGTYAHEHGHALFKWVDYYGTNPIKFQFGQIRNWGIMGSGDDLDNSPALVSAYHRIQEGWTSPKQVENLEDGESKEYELKYLKDNGRPALLEIEGSHPVFDEYLFSARSPSHGKNPDLPLQNGHGGLDTAPGIAVYGITDVSGDYEIPWVDQELEYVNVVKNAERDSYRTVSVREYHDDVLKDPDAGIMIRAKSGSFDTAILNVTGYEPTNKTGVNVFARLNCKDEDTSDDQPCPRIASDGNSSDLVQVGVIATTDGGTVGVTANGTVVNSVEGGNVVAAGAVAKVYVPKSSAAAYTVDLSHLPNGTNITLVTQTVTRNGQGERIASGLRTTNVSADDAATYEPELARLNTSIHAASLQNVRTLDTKTVTFSVENNGIRTLENVSITADSEWITIENGSIGDIAASSQRTASFGIDVPGGAPVGNHTFNVTVRGDGTKSVQTERITVRVEVLPTVYWSAKPASAERRLATSNTTSVPVTVTVDDASNVPLRDVEAIVEGNVTRLDVEADSLVTVVEPGESTVVTTEFSVPEGGIEEGAYDGTITVDPLRNYSAHFDYPVSIPSSYSTLNRSAHVTDTEVTAVGPNVSSNTSFHPERQVAMRRGSMSQYVRVDSRGPGDVPAKRISVAASIPEGWHPQGQLRDKDVTVWVVTETGGTSRGSNANDGGKRVKLDPANYTVRVDDDRVFVTVANLSATRFGSSMDADQYLEFEYKLSKDKRATEYGYSSTVKVMSVSPIAVFREETPSASVEVFDPPKGTARSPVDAGPSRVAERTIRVDAEGLGQNATLEDPHNYAVERNGREQWWTQFDISAPGHDTKNVWIRSKRLNSTTHEVRTIDGTPYLVLDAKLTRNVRGAVASSLANARQVTVLIPLNDTVDASSIDLGGSTMNGTGSLVLSDEEGRTVGSVEMNVTEISQWSMEGSIPVVVGPDVFDAREVTTNSTSTSRASNSTSIRRVIG